MVIREWDMFPHVACKPFTKLQKKEKKKDEEEEEKKKKKVEKKEEKKEEEKKVEKKVEEKKEEKKEKVAADYMSRLIKILFNFLLLPYSFHQYTSLWLTKYSYTGYKQHDTDAERSIVLQNSLETDTSSSQLIFLGNYLLIDNWFLNKY